MNLQRLEYFLAVAEELHFGRAAKRLHMSQPPLSQQIRLLESELGVTLFHRSTRHVELTDAGTLLHPLARRLVSESEHIKRAMEEFVEGSRGQLRVGFVDSAAYAVVPRFINLFRDTWSLIDFSLESMSSDQQIRALSRGEIDIGICRTTGSRQDVRSVELHREPLLLAVHPGHRYSARDTVELTELVGERFVGFDRHVSETLHAELRGMLATQGVSYDPSIEATEYSTVLGLVASGLGVAVVPAGVVTFHPPGLTYIKISDSLAWLSLLLIARTDDERSVISKSFAIAERLASQLGE